MKRFFKIALSAFLVVIVVGSLYLIFTLPQERSEFKILVPSLGRGAIGGEYVTAVLNCSLPEVPKTLPVLRVVRHDYTYAEAETIARNIFNMTGELDIKEMETLGNTASGMTCLWVKNDDQSLMLFGDGAINYMVHVPSSYAEYGVELPEFPQAKQIADEFLTNFFQKAKQYGLTPSYSGMEITFADVFFSEWYSIPPGPTIPTRIAVCYRVTYDGIPLSFKGGISVEIGKDGNLVDFYCYWRNVEPGEALPITVSPEQAIRNMGNNSLTGRDPRKIQNITINSVELGYFAPSPSYGADKFLPAYSIEFVATFEDGSEGVYGTYVSATDVPSPY